MKHKGCFHCCKTFVDHTWRNCDQDEKATVGNSGLAKEVKQETNFVSEAEEYQYEPSEEYHVVPPIVLPVQLDYQVSTQGLIDSGSTSDLISEKLIN